MKNVETTWKRENQPNRHQNQLQKSFQSRDSVSSGSNLSPMSSLCHIWQSVKRSTLLCFTEFLTILLICCDHYFLKFKISNFLKNIKRTNMIYVHKRHHLKFSPINIRCREIVPEQTLAPVFIQTQICKTQIQLVFYSSNFISTNFRCRRVFVEQTCNCMF